MSEYFEYDLDFTGDTGDSGPVFELQCSKCGDTIRVARYAWWDTTCNCGIRWEIDISASGIKDD